jgi:hypothetical protein
MNEHRDVLEMYVDKPATNCVASDDGTTMQDHIIDEYEWCMIGELDAVVRPVGPFISTMEATERVTSSLVLLMTSGLLHATNKLVPVLRLVYKHGVLHEERSVDHDDLCTEVQEVRNVLHNENIRRFRDGEREGHTEDLLICTILDPRFKLMNYVGCSAKHKDCAELYLRENYKADWSPSAVEKALKNSTPPARDDDVVEVDEASTSAGHVAPAQAPEVPPMFKKVSKQYFPVSMYA